MAVIPFAMVTDLETRWRRLNEIERPRAESALLDASAMMAKAMRDSGVDYENADELLQASLVAVCCSVVRRSMSSPSDMPALTQYSQGAIGMTESMSFANPSGDFYLTKQEKRQLGITRTTIGSIRPDMRGLDGGQLAYW